MTRIGIRYFILNNELQNNLYLVSIINLLNHEPIDTPMDINNPIVKFTLNTPEEEYDLKQYLIPYADPNKSFSNTLENILLFNDIQINNGNVNLKIFENGFKEISFDYNDVKSKHITYFSEL
jgi:hypothetical protein